MSRVACLALSRLSKTIVRCLRMRCRSDRRATQRDRSENAMEHIHPAFRDRLPTDAKLWRYLTFAKFAALLQSGALHFSRVDRFDDHFEGAWPQSDDAVLANLKGFDIRGYTERMRSMVAASCWLGSEFESAAMWRLYIREPGEGVAITTTFGKLAAVVEAMNEAPAVGLAGVGKVAYMDHVNEGLIAHSKPDEPLPNTLLPFMIKNKSYEHEKEVRALVVAEHGMEIEEGGIRQPLDLADFITEIVVSPFAPGWLSDAVQSLVSGAKLNTKIRASSLTPRLFRRNQGGTLGAATSSKD